MTEERTAEQTGFHALTQTMALNLVEEALDKPFRNFCLPLSSYINRVYEMQSESGEKVIAKFYRPGRWSRAALEDEQEFMRELAAEELPVIAPLELAEGGTLGEFEGMYFTVFPKKAGRPLDEPHDEEWLQLGRLLARMHTIGAQKEARDRVKLHPDFSTRESVNFLLNGDFITAEHRKEYEELTLGLIETIRPMFDGVESLRIHGDCHQGNILNRLDGRFYLIDFDDMAQGPPVQDFWMLLPGYARECMSEISMFLEGYETFRPFQRSTLPLIEALRVMRYIYFTAWCALQVADGGFKRVAPEWGTAAFWRRELNDIRRQLSEIENARNISWYV